MKALYTVAAIVFALLLGLTGTLGASEFASLTMADGDVFTHVDVIDLKPDYLVITSDSGTARIRYERLPKEVQTRYGFGDEALAKAVAAGIDGDYFFREDAAVSSGDRIEVRGETFTWRHFVETGRAPEPLHGKFRISGQWFLLQNKLITHRERILALVEGRLAIFMTTDYLRWKQTGKAEHLKKALFRHPSPS